MALYAPRKDERILSLPDWSEGEWSSFPARRIDLEGDREQPLLLQAAVFPEELGGLLKNSGWRAPPRWNLKTLLGLLSPSTAIENLPLLPRLHAGRPEVLRLLLQRNSDERLVLRFWSAGAQSPEGFAYLEGTLEIQRRNEVGHFFTLARAVHDQKRALSEFKKNLPSVLSRKEVRRLKTDKPSADEPSSPEDWGKEVLLLWQKDFKENVLRLIIPHRRFMVIKVTPSTDSCNIM